LVFGNLITQANNVAELKKEINASITDNNFTKSVKLCDKLAKLHYDKGEHELAIASLEQALIYGENIQDPKIQSEIYFHLGMIYNRKGSFTEALKSFKSGFQLIKNTSDLKTYIKFNVKIAYTYTSLGNSDEAYRRLLQLKDKVAASKQPDYLRFVYYEMGTLHYYQEHYNQALAYYEKTKVLAGTDDPYSFYNSLAAIASCYSALNQEEEALCMHLESLEIAQELNYAYGIASANTNIAETYFLLNKLKESKAYFLVALDNMKSINDAGGSIKVLSALAEIAALNTDKKLAIEYIDQSLVAAELIDGDIRLQKLYKNISKTYDLINMPTQALVFLNKHLTLKERLTNEKNIEKMATIKAKYEIEKSERDNKIALLGKDSKITQMYAIGGCGITLFLALITLLLLSRYKLQKETNKLLAQSKKEIEEQNIKLIASNKSLEQFAYIASHDLKEPLRTVSSYSGLLKRRYFDKLDEEAKEYFGFMIDATKRMYRLLDDTMSYSKISNDLPGEEVVDLNEVIGYVLNNLKTEIDKNQAIIEVKRPLPKILAKETLTVQLFQNFISNALKFQQKNQRPHIKISYEKDIKNRLFTFKVQDNGIGIAPEFHDKVFEAFKRLNVQNEYEGSGVGLAICHKIITNMDGKIWIDSAEGQGTTFFFTIPMSSIELAMPAKLAFAEQA